MSNPTILIIEDEPSLVDVLSYNLKKEGFQVVSATDGREGLQLAQKVLPDLVLLDLMLPEMDGLQVCRHIRSSPHTQHVRILMLTARSEEVDEIVGFNMGADDYVTKPFKVKPLMHRIKALLRRTASNTSNNDTVTIQGIHINRLSHVATLDDRELRLTPTEFQLLWTLSRHPGRAFSRAELMERCRGQDAPSLERTIDVHIRSLRQKLGPRAHLVETVRGIGYRFQSGTRA